MLAIVYIHMASLRDQEKIPCAGNTLTTHTKNKIIEDKIMCLRMSEDTTTPSHEKEHNNINTFKIRTKLKIE